MLAPEVKEFRILNLARLNKIINVWWPVIVGDVAVADRVVATDKVRAAIHDIRRQYGLDVPTPKEPPLGSTPDKPLHVTAVPGTIDWDAIPDDLAEEFLALNARIVALQHCRPTTRKRRAGS